MEGAECIVAKFRVLLILLPYIVSQIFGCMPYAEFNFG